MKIVIFSQMTDISTSEIMSWIMHYGGEVIRINLDDPEFQILSICQEYILIHTSFGIVKLLPTYYYWFRRAKLASAFFSNNTDIKKSQESYFCFQENMDALYAVYWWIIDKCQYIANPFMSSPCKLHTLRIASDTGFLIPDTIFTSLKIELFEFVKKHARVAAKPFTAFSLVEGDTFIKSLTNCIEKKDLADIPDEFGGMILQNYIEKKYELRIFLFNNTFYSMAIFSQNDDKTKFDFRNYNEDKPNKVVPFNLSQQYADKLLKIAKSLNLDSGSFDIIVDSDDNYYFLEVNPIGQFGMVSVPCNYQAEKHIALCLVNQMKTQKHEERI